MCRTGKRCIGATTRTKTAAVFGLRTVISHVLARKLMTFPPSLPGYGHRLSSLIVRLSAQVIPGGFFAVDTFFLMSGFLVSSVLLSKLGTESPGRYGWIVKGYVHRYLRLTPTLAFVTLVMWKVLPLLGEGPSWWPIAAAQQERCRR